VNTLKREGDGWLGDNTDGAGLVRDLTVNLQFPIADARVLLMGAGGAARGVLLPLLLEQPRSLTIANRTPPKAERLRDEINENSGHAKLARLVRVSDYANVGDENFDLIINATSASLNDTLPPLPASVFSNARLAYDMMYGVGMTPFLTFARDAGAAKAAEGIGMLVEQAAESFYLWRNLRPPTRELIARLRSC